MKKSICIAHAETLGSESGGTLRTAVLAKALSDSGYHVDLVAPQPDKSTNIPDRLNDIKIHTVPISANGAADQLPRAIAVARRAIKLSNKNDSILQVERAPLAGIVALLGGRDYVLDLHDISFNGPLYGELPPFNIPSKVVYWIEKLGALKAKSVIAVSKHMKRFVCENWGVSRKNAHIIHNGVREEILDYGSTHMFKTNPQQVSFLGNISRNVDINKFIKLANELNIELHIIGDGYKKRSLEKIVSQSKLQNIIVHGYLPDNEAYEIISQSQVTVFPLHDNHHTKMSQHMKAFDYGALSKPIATDRDGTAELFEEHNAALVSDPSDASELVDNTRTLLQDENMRKELGRNARDLSERYTWKNQGQELVDLYE